MKRPLFLLITIVWVIAAPKISHGSSGKRGAGRFTYFTKVLPRIAIAGLGIESSTFSPARTNEAAFHAKYGSDVFSYYPFFSADSSLRNRAKWLPAIEGHALPGGTVTREAYESLVNQTLNLLKKNLPYAGLFLDIHGAMSVVGPRRPRRRLYREDQEGSGYANYYIHLDGPSWECIVAAGRKFGPDHLLPHGPA